MDNAKVSESVKPGGQNAETDFQLWQDMALAQTKKGSLDQLARESDDGIPIKALYTLEDVEGLPQQNTMPGMAPYIRGPYATMYWKKPWTIRQYAGFSTAEKSNAFYKELLAQGAQGISVAFDLATHRGYDSDHSRVVGDIGKAGVAVDSVEDMKTLFDGIPLDNVSVSMTMNGAVLPILASYIVAALEQGASLSDLRGTIQNDILKEFMVRNTYIYPPEPSMRIVGDIIAYITQNMPKFNSISISGYHMQEAGASPAMELAYTLADGKEYLKTALEVGLDIDQFAPRLSFFFGIGMDFYSEIAKLRAARLLWAEVVSEFGAKNKKALMLRTHCQTSGWSLTEQDPYNNIVRTTLESMAAVFGGTQSLHSNGFDEAISLPTETSARIARNTQLILQQETGVCNVIDPWGGSYMMESLTHSIADEARKLMSEVESMGGMTYAIEKGLPKQKIEEKAARKQAMIDSGETVIVGVNKFELSEKAEVETLDIDGDEVRGNQISRLNMVRMKRQPELVESALSDLKQCAESGRDNLLHLAVEAMKNRATVGEVSETLAEVWGRYNAKTNVITSAYRNAYAKEDEYQQILTLVRDFEKKHGRRPRMLVCKMGQDGHDRGAKVIATSFCDMGFDIDLSPLFATPEEVARQAVENDVHMVGVSSLAGSHRTLIPKLMTSLKNQGAEHILVCVGGVIPDKDYQELFQVGVKNIFSPGSKIPDIAKKLIAAIQGSHDEGR